jgi:RNA polymerase sigma-70 factor (ECF subfamily)
MRLDPNMTPSILQRIASGDAGAVREAVDQYGGLVWSLARRLSRTRLDAEDATQEIFLQIWRQAARFDDNLGSETLFVAMIARRSLIDRLTKTGGEPRIRLADELFECLACYDVGNVPGICVEADLAVPALAALQPEYRYVLELGLLQGLTQPEIAKRLNRPLATVRWLMRGGLMRVREGIDLDAKKRRHTYPKVPRPPVEIGAR